jgi:hypothetical protein
MRINYDNDNDKTFSGVAEVAGNSETTSSPFSWNS